MSLPASVIEFLQDDFVSESRPFCLQLDAGHRLLESSGDGDWSGLANLQPGTDMLEHAPFLHGVLGDEPQKLNFLSTGKIVVHLLTIPYDGGHYVVILDAGQSHDFLQQRQQSANEMRLLHAAQQKLIARQRDLITELIEAKSELDHHRRDIERNSAGKSRFIAMMSHEFRTPLASIINYANLAREADASSSDVQKSIEAIARSGQHLNSLVEAVLDEARLDAGQVQLRERQFDLFALLDDVAAILAPLAAEKALSFATLVDSDVPQHVITDDVCLRQILINLLGNAVKFTDDGSVRLYMTFNDERLIATVADTGPGIGRDDQERIFRAFERGSGAPGGQQGAGLGLTITMQLVELLGGEVSLDSSPGNGSTFSVHVPIRIGEAALARSSDLPPPPDASVQATEARTVLICDDDPDMRALLEHYLHRAGYAIIAAENAADAVDKAVSMRPDIVLMDINVPGMSGTEAAAALRQRDYAGPLLALTASLISDSEKQQFTRCFRKPADMQELLLTIKSLTHD